MLHPEARLRAVRGCQRPVHPEDGSTNKRNRNLKGTTLSLLKDIGGSISLGHCLERVYAVFLDSAVQTRQRVAVVKDAEPGAQHPGARGAVGDAQPGADVIPVLVEAGGQTLKVVTRAQVYGQTSPRRPVVLNEKPVAGHAEARGWAAEGLPKRVGVTAREVGQARKNVDSSKSVGH